MIDNRPHQPVLLQEVIEWMAPVAGGVYVDATFGRGGYTEALLATNNTVVWAFDRDLAAIEAGQALQKKYPNRLHLLHERFANMKEALQGKGVESVDGAVMDIGVSSPQIDEAERGFSFRQDGPLDMRMGKCAQSAADIVNTSSEEELSNIIFNYGEERMARRVARAIVKARLTAPFTRTAELAALVRSVVPGSRDGIDPATRTFQGLRIAVNDELNELEKGLDAAESLLKKGGRLVVVSFHSLEDRIVKNFMRARAGKMANLSRHMPAANTNQEASLKILTPKPIQASDAELAVNPRASSAKLRAAVRIFSENQLESLGVNPRHNRK